VGAANLRRKGAWRAPVGGPAEGSRWGGRSSGRPRPAALSRSKETNNEASVGPFH